MVENSRKQIIIVIFLLTVLIGLLLSINTQYINYWPSDSHNPYIPTARHFFSVPFPSQIHNIPIAGITRLTMHGKETLILGIALMQKILNDYESLYPNVLLLIIANTISSCLVYFITKRFLNNFTGLIAYILFTFCFWPYLYILQGAHPPLSLMNFLLSILFLQQAQRQKSFYLLSGIALGLMLFSSPTAPLYLPYYIATYIFYEYKFIKNKKKIATTFLKFLITFLGFSFIFLYFSLPHPLESIHQYIKFLNFSQTGNNFTIYKNFLSAHYFFVPDHFRGAGFIWIIKYFFLIMPIGFPLFLMLAFYLLSQSVRKPHYFSFVLLCSSTPILVEIIHVVQFGRNYFPWIVGIFALICYGLYHIKNNILARANKKFIQIFNGLIIIILGSHIIFNIYIFTTDVFPSRLATTYIHNWFIQHRTNEIAVYNNHPRNKNIVRFLTNPKLKHKIYPWGINHLHEAQDGFILIPPITGKTILDECRLEDFESDPDLNQLIQTGEIAKYTVASFKTLASSRIWNQEEEICTYRDLILGQISDEDRKKGVAYILDAKALQKKWRSQQN